ncbi:Os06g0555101 [Oryza sativa Japonica Group]|uniref:Os06g0555101 protein n=1 Tax=Oryza sativa subsp. japonica TaxID=39947 RepID=A0A0N7KM98_ORYSJ|nr:Os06g0555101 [Oryza sativa Japonica Group]
MYAAVFCATNSSSSNPLYVTSPPRRSDGSSFPARARRRVVFPDDGGPSSSVIREGRTAPETPLRMVSVACRPGRTPTSPSAASAMLRAVFSSVGSARLPTWHLACTISSSNRTSTVGSSMLAYLSIRLRSFWRNRWLSSSATRKTRSMNSCLSPTPSRRTSTSLYCCLPAPAAAAAASSSAEERMAVRMRL